MPYRVFLPKTRPGSRRFPVVYLLHGGGGGFRDWSNYSDVSRYAAEGLILVMPEGESSYYTNAADRPEDRFEDYIVRDLITDVENRFPAKIGRDNRAIAGISMGGYGAVKLAVKFPQLFIFAAGISPALDVPSRPFSIKRWQQWRYHRSIFGKRGGQTEKENDPFVLAGSVDPAATPYLYLSCGKSEGLLPANQRFAALLKRRGFAFQFHDAPGGHNWAQWKERLPDLFLSLSQHVDLQHR